MFCCGKALNISLWKSIEYFAVKDNKNEHDMNKGNSEGCGAVG